jgi:hypothetical protein
MSQSWASGRLDSSRQRICSRSPRDIIDEETTKTAAIVTTRHRSANKGDIEQSNVAHAITPLRLRAVRCVSPLPESFLPSCVPDLQFHLLLCDGQDLTTELDTDRMSRAFLD